MEEVLTTEKVKLQNMAVSIAIADLIDQARVKMKAAKAKKHDLFLERDKVKSGLTEKVTQDLRPWISQSVIIQGAEFKSLSFSLFDSFNQIREKVSLDMVWEKPDMHARVTQTMESKELFERSDALKEYSHILDLCRDAQKQIDDIEEEIADIGAMKNRYTKKIAVDVMATTPDGKAALETAKEYVTEIQQILNKEKQGIETPLLLS